MDQKAFKPGFSIAQLDSYRWPVDVKVPANGGYETYRFTGIFKHLSSADAAAMLAGFEQHDIDEQDPMAAVKMAQYVTDKQVDLYMQIWLGWEDDLTDAQGKPLPCTEEARRQLLRQRMIREGVMAAHKASQGGEEPRVGNSAMSPGTGSPEAATSEAST